ncbi:MAG TPA: hypothetical protein VHV51_08350 [Polyangiaceae bacterium]|nr:hypothetical protein [Polyangiaceae bacterium]
MAFQRLRRTILACALACSSGLIACGGGDGGSSPSAGTQTGDEGDVSTPGVSCAPACASGGTCCARKCVDEGTDVSNCGKCGNQCASGATCVQGACTTPPAQ